MFGKAATVAAALITAVTSAALAASRDDQLRALALEHRMRGEAIGEEAVKRQQWILGTAFNEMGREAFSCAALAFLFDKREIHERLGAIEETPLESAAAGPEKPGLVFDSRLHANWAEAAETVLALSPRDRIENWNLNCVCQHGTGPDQAMRQAAANAEFRIVGDQLHVLGNIDRGFHARFAAFLAMHPTVKTVALGSGGGSVRDAIQAGLLIRSRRLDTTLNGDCYSACPLIFLGGVQRTVWSPYPRLGFHQVSRDYQAVPAADPVYGVIEEYSDSLGVEGKRVVSLMLQSTPASLTFPDVSDLCTPNITTWVQRQC